MLSAVGLAANFIGSVVLLAANVSYLEGVLKRIDPIHRVYVNAFRWVQTESISGTPEKGRAHPYDHAIEATWRVWPLLHLVKRNVEEDISYDCEIDIQGGHFKIDGDELMLAGGRRRVDIPEPDVDGGVSLDTQGRVTLSAVRGLIFEARRKRIYFWGALGLTLGFALQLIDTIAAPI